MSARFTRARLPAPVTLTRVESPPLRHATFKRLDRPAEPPLSAAGRCSLGRHPLCDVVVDSPGVAPFHCEVHHEADGPWLTEIPGGPGVEVDGVTVRCARLRDSSVLRFGALTVRFNLAPQSTAPALSPRDGFGGLWGASEVMRERYATLERVAGTSRPVLLHGPPGSGKRTAARAIHELGPRRDQPLVTVELPRLAATDAALRLFGSVRPARPSVFEEVGAGTLYLEEVSLLSPEVQRRLVPVLESGEVTRLGGAAPIVVKARIIAGSSVDLRAGVNRGRFLPALMHRLGVVEVSLPPLAERLEDLPGLVDVCLERLAVDVETAVACRSTETIERLLARPWPTSVAGLFAEVEALVDGHRAAGGPPADLEMESAVER